MGTPEMKIWSFGIQTWDRSTDTAQRVDEKIGVKMFKKW